MVVANNSEGSKLSKKWGAPPGLEGMSDLDGARHFGPMNCIGWTVGHLAWQEQRYFLQRAQGQVLFPELNVTYAYGSPMSTPALSDTLRLWG